MSIKKYNEAIWYPILSRELFISLVCGFMLVLALIVFCLPDIYGNKFSFFIKEIADNIADVRYQSSVSKFPFVVSTVYSLVLLLSPLFAALFCFTKIDIATLRKVKIKKAWLVIFGGLIFYFLPFFAELRYAGVKSIAFWRAVADYKIIFLLYIEIMFLMYITILCFLFCKITALARRVQ